MSLALHVSVLSGNTAVIAVQPDAEIEDQRFGAYGLAFRV